ncbi:uncharacterized protein [Cherax quadricarinatus]|uniref:uncharacterized protein n=1 Tax=Cherax quadricarinatus TaxID=27406 RepID=UPI00387E8395
MRLNFCLKMIFLKNIRSQLVVLIIIAIFIWCYKFDNIVPLATKQVWLAYSDSHSHFSNILPSSPEEPSSVTMNGSTGFAAEEAETIDLTKMTQLPQKCDCKMKMRRSHSHTVQQLDLALPLFNLSTKEYLIKRHPNLPVDFLHKVNKEGSCSLLPSLFSIQWVNIHWQEVRVNTSTMLLYSAFYDPNPGGKPCVRLLGVTRSTKPPAGWCHLWFNTQQPPVVTRITNTEDVVPEQARGTALPVEECNDKNHSRVNGPTSKRELSPCAVERGVVEIEYFSTDYLDYQTRNSDRQMPFLFTCPLPPKVAHLQPAAVSLVHQPCQPATTLLQGAAFSHLYANDLDPTLDHLDLNTPTRALRARPTGALRARPTGAPPARPPSRPPTPSAAPSAACPFSWAGEGGCTACVANICKSRIVKRWVPAVTRCIFHRAVKGWVPAVCGPALYYYHEDFSKRMVEWLEILRAEGIGKVFLYVTDVHPNLEKVLKYYEDDGFLHLTGYSYPPPYINEPSLRRLWTLVERSKMFAQENIYFTDCLLRHMHQYRFIAHYDPDEIPFLFKHDNYTLFLDHLLAT